MTVYGQEMIVPLNRIRLSVGVGPKGGPPCPRNRHTVEQIITKLRGAEVTLSEGQLVRIACPENLPDVSEPTV